MSTLYKDTWAGFETIIRECLQLLTCRFYFTRCSTHKGDFISQSDLNTARMLLSINKNNITLTIITAILITFKILDMFKGDNVRLHNLVSYHIHRYH